MFIIFGTRGVTTTKNHGAFFCPACNGQTSYSHRQVKRFFTLFFVPLIPMGTRGEYVECQRCGCTFKEEVLQLNPASEVNQIKAEFETTMIRVMVQMMVADGKVEEEEIETMQQIYLSLTDKELSSHEIEKEISASHTSKEDVLLTLVDAEPFLNSQGKEMVFKAALIIAASDGNIDEAEKEFMLEIATALGITKAHFLGLIQDFATV